MDPAKMLLLPTLFFSLLLLMVPSHCKVDTTSTTSAINRASNTVCGITIGFLQYRRIQCQKFPKSADSTAVVPSLRDILSGVCVPDETFCSYGIFSDSGYLCGGSRVICKKSDTSTRESCKFCPAILKWLQDLSQTRWKKLCKWLFASTLGTLFCILFLLCSLYMCICYVIRRMIKGHDDVKQFKLNEIMTMTNQFRTPLGEHTFGTVFQGQRPFGERLVAVKHFNTRLRLDSVRAFNNEVQTLSKARHPNVVRLFGYCTEKNVHILVTELKAHRDLYWHLRPRSLQQKRSELFSSWKIRMTVLLEAAQGIEYLHRYAEPRIIHRDIKAANILINDNWVARISNFGMAVFGPEPGSDYVELEEAVGTALDPECNANNQRATPRNDVYSFGVVMMEVVTGEMSIDKHAAIKLADLTAEKILSGKLMEVLDKRLAVPAGHEWEVVTRVAHLATECIRVPGLERPDMSTVVTELEDALALFDPSEASAS